jgi:outer membrane receptor for ferrienterochelin and colicin
VGYTAYQRYERDQLSLTHQGRYSFGTWQTSLTHSKSSNLAFAAADPGRARQPADAVE